jgi:hypothetical protein
MLLRETKEKEKTHTHTHTHTHMQVNVHTCILMRRSVLCFIRNRLFLNSRRTFSTWACSSGVPASGSNSQCCRPMKLFPLTSPGPPSAIFNFHILYIYIYTFHKIYMIVWYDIYLVKYNFILEKKLYEYYNMLKDIYDLEQI